jgi:uncharacterized protein YukE
MADGQVTETVDTPASLWRPMGDPVAINAAAGAWSSLAQVLAQASTQLQQVGEEIPACWGGEAADRFTAWVTGMTSELSDASSQCAQVARWLTATAARIEQANTEIQRLYEALAVTAVVGVLATVITFGVSDVAAAAAAAATAAEAEGIVAMVTANLAEVASALSPLAARWLVNFGVSLGLNVGVDLMRGKELSLEDAESAVLSASFGTLGGAVAGGWAGVEARPVTTAVLSSMMSQATEDIIDGKQGVKLAADVATAGVLGGTLSKVADALHLPELPGGEDEPGPLQLGEPVTPTTPPLVDAAGVDLIPTTPAATPSILDADGVPIGSAATASATPVTILGPDGVPTTGNPTSPGIVDANGTPIGGTATTPTTIPPTTGPTTVLDSSGLPVGAVGTTPPLVDSGGNPLSASGITVPTPSTPAQIYLPGVDAPQPIVAGPVIPGSPWVAAVNHYPDMVSDKINNTVVEAIPGGPEEPKVTVPPPPVVNLGPSSTATTQAPAPVLVDAASH